MESICLDIPDTSSSKWLKLRGVGYALRDKKLWFKFASKRSLDLPCLRMVVSLKETIRYGIWISTVLGSGWFINCGMVKLCFPLFWDYNIISSFSFSLSSVQTLPCTLPFSFSESWPHIFIIFCYTHICLCIYMYIPKYNHLNLYSVICMHTFRADYLI